MTLALPPTDRTIIVPGGVRPPLTLPGIAPGETKDFGADIRTSLAVGDSIKSVSASIVSTYGDMTLGTVGYVGTVLVAWLTAAAAETGVLTWTAQTTLGDTLVVACSIASQQVLTPAGAVDSASASATQAAASAAIATEDAAIATAAAATASAQAASATSSASSAATSATTASNAAAAAAARQLQFALFSTPGTATWVCPVGVTQVKATVVAGSAAIVGGTENPSGAGGFGVGIYPVTLGTTYNITVGAGSTSVGPRAGASSFDSFLSALGGRINVNGSASGANILQGPGPFGLANFTGDFFTSPIAGGVFRPAFPPTTPVATPWSPSAGFAPGASVLAPFTTYTVGGVGGAVLLEWIGPDPGTPTTAEISWFNTDQVAWFNSLPTSPPTHGFWNNSNTLGFVP